MSSEGRSFLIRKSDGFFFCTTLATGLFTGLHLIFQFAQNQFLGFNPFL